jgi:hypothetical protein
MSLILDDSQYSTNDIPDMNLVTPEKLNVELQTLYKQVPTILDDYKKAYLFYNKNPQNNEYQQKLETVTNQLNNIASKLFMLNNNIETNTDEINKKLFIINILIENAKEKNKKLKRKLGFVEHRHNITDDMINDYKLIYNIGYLRNWGLVLSIIIVGFTISKVFTNKNMIK